MVWVLAAAVWSLVLCGVMVLLREECFAPWLRPPLVVAPCVEAARTTNKEEEARECSLELYIR